MFKKISFTFVCFMIYMSVYGFANELPISENFNIEYFLNSYNQRVLGSRKITNYELRNVNDETYYVCKEDDTGVILMLRIENKNLLAIDGIFSYELNGESIALLEAAKCFGLDEKISFGEFWYNVVNSYKTGKSQILWKEDNNIFWTVYSKPISEKKFFIFLGRSN